MMALPLKATAPKSAIASPPAIAGRKGATGAWAGDRLAVIARRSTVVQALIVTARPRVPQPGSQIPVPVLPKPVHDRGKMLGFSP